MSVPGATDRQIGKSYDANGNLSYDYYPTLYYYDAENHLLTGDDQTWYTYDPQGKRVMVQTATPDSSQYVSMFTFYGVTGQKLATFSVCSGGGPGSDYCSGTVWYSTKGPWAGYVYFGSQQLLEAGNQMLTDRLGSNLSQVSSYYPWGEDRQTASDGRVKFATYYRDAPGQDYADQRYYNANAGRFFSPDPSTDGVDYENPLTWNAYSYVNGDPINFNDPSGLGPVTLPPVVPGVNCSTAFINYAGQFGMTIQQLFDSDTGILGVMSYFEQKGSGTSGDQSIWAALDWTFLNRWDLSASDKAWFYGPSNIPTSFAASVTTGNSRSQVFTSGGQLQAGFTTQLMNILTGSPDSSQCEGLAVAFDTAMGTIRAHDHDPISGLGYIPNPVPGALQFGSNGAVPSVGPYVTQTVVATMTDRGNLWAFYGATYNPPPPVRRPPRRPPTPPGRGRRPL
jgi:RHS repeat-associated protein